MVPGQWQNLNGLWQYAITAKDAVAPTSYTGDILVPYPIESALSGVKKALQPNENLWYKRLFTSPDRKPGEKVLLYFGAVDWQATIFVNGKQVESHEGRYTAFSMDITALLKPSNNELVVKVFDPTDQGIGPHGKQVLNAQNIYCTPSSGIWQTVWMELVPPNYIKDIQLTPVIDKDILQVNVTALSGSIVELIAKDGATEVGKVKGKANSVLNLPVKNAKLWSPASPFCTTW